MEKTFILKSSLQGYWPGCALLTVRDVLVNSKLQEQPINIPRRKYAINLESMTIQSRYALYTCTFITILYSCKSIFLCIREENFFLHACHVQMNKVQVK